MKKILFVIPTLTGRGAEKVLVNLVNNLDRDKYDITLMVLFDSGVNKSYLRKEVKYKYIYKKIFRGNIHFFKFWKPEVLYKKMIKDNYDIIVSYLEGPTTRIVSGCNNKKTVIINWVHIETTNIYQFTKVYRNKKEFETCMKKYNMTVFVSKTAMESFKDKTKLQIPMKVLYNLIDDKRIRQKASEPIDDILVDKSKINLISVGGLVHQKGYLRLLKIYNQIVKTRQDVHLYILGEGKQRKNMETYILKNDMSTYVTMLGYKENPYKYVKNSDLFVCSSYYEGYSTAVTEAIILGVPVVTTLCSGMQELLENGKYGVITKNEEQDLFKGLLDMISNKEKMKTYKKMAEQRSEQLSLEKNLNENEKLFDSFK